MKNKTPILSIIIPVYNTEKYLQICLDSLIKQDISTEIYEIILVNDCSPDNSKGLILNYSKKYSNIIYLEHDVNKRQGAARNTGIKYAKGQYIMFVDSDDWINENSLSELTKYLDEYNDLIFISYWEHKFNGDKNIVSQENLFSGIKDGRSIIKENINFGLGPWCKIYKRDLLINNNIIFEENVQLEDVDFSVRSVLCAKKAICSTYKGYNYRYNTNSTVRQNLKPSILEDGVRLAYRLKDIANEYKNVDSYIFKKYNNSAIWTLNSSIKKSIFLNEKDRLLFKIFIKNYLRNDIKINHKNIIYLSLLNTLNPLISIFIHLYKKRKNIL